MVDFKNITTTIKNGYLTELIDIFRDSAHDRQLTIAQVNRILIVSQMLLSAIGTKEANSAILDIKNWQERLLSNTQRVHFKLVQLKQ